MARKNLLVSLVAETRLPADNSAHAAAPQRLPPMAFAGRGALGAVTRTIDDLAARAESAKELEARIAAGDLVVAIDPALIDESPVADRMRGDDEGYMELLSAIRDSGQASPILVRPHPGVTGRYQVAFGHRRLRVARELQRPVLAVVRVLSDRDLVVAQGQENSARTDLSFIERARFAHRLEAIGHDRETIMLAMNVDKTAVSRMISVASGLPAHLIEAIGPAPATGRDRWLELISLYAAGYNGRSLKELCETPEFTAADSDERFSLVRAFLSGLRQISAKPAAGRIRARGQSRVWTDSDGLRVARINSNAHAFVLTIDQLAAPAFGDYLVNELDRLYQAYRKTQPV